MRIIRHFFKNGLCGAVIGFLFCFISFYLLTSIYRNDFFISGASYSVLGFFIGSVYGLSKLFMKEKCSQLTSNQLLCDSFLGIMSSVLGCLPFVILFLYEISQKQVLNKVQAEMQEYTAQRIYDFSLYVVGIVVFSTIVICLVGLINKRSERGQD